MKIDISLDVKRATRGLDFAAKQMPFATAQAVTGLAKMVQQGEKSALPSVFDRPTPFTMNAFGITAARKGNPEAEVFAKDKQAAYLDPSEVQGPQYLGAGKAIRTPIDIKRNQYGNIPRRKIAQMIAQKKAFLAVRKGINGLWQRMPGDKLRLLVDFTAPVNVKTHLGFQHRAQKIVLANFTAVFTKALRQALDSAK